MRKVKTRAWIEDVEVYDKADGTTLAMQCQTNEQKPFAVTLIFNPQAVDKSTKGRNWRLIEKMLGGVSTADWETAHFDTKAVAAQVRNTFHWFLLHVNGHDVWLRDVKPCEPFALYDEAEAIRAVEEAFHVS
jgi:hypothetical protein